MTAEGLTVVTMVVSRIIFALTTVFWIFAKKERESLYLASGHRDSIFIVNHLEKIVKIHDYFAKSNVIGGKICFHRIDNLEPQKSKLVKKKRKCLNDTTGLKNHSKIAKK